MKEIKNEKTIKQFVEASNFKANFSFDIDAYIKLFHYSAGEYIVKELEKPNYLFYLVKGSAKFYVTSSNGKTNLIDFFSANCFIGEVELVDTKLEAKSVQAIEDCWCLALALSDIEDKALSDPKFLRNICIFSFEKNHRNIISSMRNQSFKLENRFAYFILLSSNRGIYSEKHTLTAQYLGVSYRHLLQVLSNFVESGYLEKDGNYYRIVDNESLRSLASGLIED